MTIALILGIASAILYGLTDFVARFANRRAGVLRTLFWGQGFLALVLTAAMAVVHTVPKATAIDGCLLLVSNLAVIAGTGCLYHGLAIGRVSIVAPVMACYGAVTAILSIMTGEHLKALSETGLVVAGIGAILSASPGRAAAKTGSSGWLPATGAALLYGLGFWLQGKYTLPRFGPVFSLWTYYLTATLITGALCLLQKHTLRLEARKDMVLVLGSAALAGSGYAALLAGQTTGAVAVVTALSAASTAVTVLLAFVFLKDKPRVNGWLGVGLVVSGIALLHLA